MEKKIPEPRLSEHHMRARKMFLDAARRGDITYEEADALYMAWLKRRRAGVGSRPTYEPAAEKTAEWLEQQMGLPPAEFNEAWPQWWREGVPAMANLNPVQIRILRILDPMTHHIRATTILHSAVQRGLLNHAEAAKVYKIWLNLRRGVR